jgi:hypothetical protein
MSEKLHHLEAIAQAAKALGLDHVSFYVSPEAVEALLTVPGAQLERRLFRHSDGRSYVVESVYTGWAGVKFNAQREGAPPTEEEIEQLERAEITECKSSFKTMALER